MITIDFPHNQSAHCESGVTSNLMSYHGLPISEAMAFGIGGGLFFGYFPVVRINHMPLVTFRSAAGSIFKRVARNLHITTHQQTFRDQDKAMAVLDETLAQGIPVGLQVSVYWLPFIPRAFRFHFNAHNLVVYGKQGDNYLVSDPVLEDPVLCNTDDLARARFAKGALAPKGRMYYITRVPDQIDLQPAMLDGINHVIKMMEARFFLVGVRGIRFMAGRLQRWPDRLGKDKALLHLGHLVRMQEEIGTGGGGFRFVFAAFLQEAAEKLHNAQLIDCSVNLTEAGDKWRDFAVMAARHCKGRPTQEDTYGSMADCIREVAALESKVYSQLKDIVRQNR